jgi:hypothetical protein
MCEMITDQATLGTITEATIITTYRELKSVRKTAESLGLPYEKCRLIILNILGTDNIDIANMRAPDEDMLMALYRKNMNDSQIAREYGQGITPDRVRRWRKERHLPANRQSSRERTVINRAQFAERTGGAETLSEFNIMQILNDAPEGLTFRELQTKLTLSYNYLYSNLRRMTQRKLLTKRGLAYILTSALQEAEATQVTQAKEVDDVDSTNVA